MTRWLYSLLLYTLVPYALAHLVYRARRQPLYLRHMHERFGYYRTEAPREVLWLHAVSVGEVRAAQPLVQALQARYPKYKILMTYMTPTGRETGWALYGNTVIHAYLAYDLPGAVQRFLRYFNPKLGLLVETEIWPNLIHHCKQRGIPLLLVNARLSEKSKKKYGRFPKFTRKCLRGFRAIAAQTEQDRERLLALGAGQVSVMGNLKFDILPSSALLTMGQAWRQQWGSARPVLLAASTREGEEALILARLSNLDVADLLMLIVPRHPQRFNEVEGQLKALGIPYQRRSLSTAVLAETKVLLGDSLGEMPAYYSACDLAFIGGSLLPYGGQNLIEACAAGKPILLGPHTYNFEQAADDAITSGAALRVANVEALMNEAQTLLADPAQLRLMAEAALRFADRYRGATGQLINILKPYVNA